MGPLLVQGLGLVLLSCRSLGRVFPFPSTPIRSGQSPVRLTPAHEWRTRVKGGTDMSETREPGHEPQKPPIFH